MSHRSINADRLQLINGIAEIIDPEPFKTSPGRSQSHLDDMLEREADAIIKSRRVIDYLETYGFDLPPRVNKHAKV